MRKHINYILLFLIFTAGTALAPRCLYSQDETPVKITKKDTSYSSIANSRIINMLKYGKAPRATIQLSFNYNIGHMDLAASENTLFRKEEFINGANFGTRYGFGAMLTGKIALHKEGNVRLNVSAGFNRFMSNFVIAESPEGRVAYNVFTGGLGFENNFTPNRKFKPYVGLDFLANLINGKALLATDSADFELKVKNSLRFGLSFTIGFEYAVNNKVGFNLGYRITHANIIGRESKVSTSLSETYLNDEKVTGDPIPYAGWRQFVYSSFYAGVNFYIGMKNRK